MHTYICILKTQLIQIFIQLYIYLTHIPTCTYTQVHTQKVCTLLTDEFKTNPAHIHTHIHTHIHKHFHTHTHTYTHIHTHTHTLTLIY